MTNSKKKSWFGKLFEKKNDSGCGCCCGAVIEEVPEVKIEKKPAKPTGDKSQKN